MTSTRRSLFTRFFPEQLRPPGALPEAEFLARCIKCGSCTSSCPYQTIRQASWSAGLAVGTPVIHPRETPCYLCMICPEVCPTGALEPVTKQEVNMGEAVVDADTCYAFIDILCRACVDICPFQGTAIRQNAALEPVVDTESCVGCGLCVKACPAQPEAIRVVRNL
ncbi:MAG: 4Fe-4S dicluster domain-containing protein [bacterium]|nr:4Fe-4S dicluster domain-containing protein [bacterium]